MYVCAPLPFTVIYTCQVISYIALLSGGLADGSGSFNSLVRDICFLNLSSARFLYWRAMQLLGDWSVK